MADGNTPQGAWLVHLEFTADEVAQLVRSIETATMYSGSSKNSSGQPLDTMQVVAYREFLKSILVRLQQALKEQKPRASS